jgi:hypothetical protein
MAKGQVKQEDTRNMDNIIEHRNPPEGNKKFLN